MSHSTAGRKSALVQSGPVPGPEVVVVVVEELCVVIVVPGLDVSVVAEVVVLGFVVVSEPSDGVVLAGRSQSGCK